jgi:probable O-glycosylation ligase (exosortase A-associated)
MSRRHFNDATPPPGLTTPVRLERTDGLFFLYLVLLVAEYQDLPQAIPVLGVIRFSTVTAWILFALTVRRVGMAAFTECRQNVLLAMFVGFTAMSVTWAMIQSSAATALRTHADYFGLFVVTMYLVDRPARIKRLAMLMSTVLIVLVFRNLDRLTAAERIAGFEGAYFFADGNDFAWGMVVLLPLALFLVTTRQGFFARMIGLAGLSAGVFGIIGTQSRGAMLALAAATVFYGLFVMKRKAIGILVLACAVAAVIAFVPGRYFERLRTLQNYGEDNSAMGRLQAWGAALRMAVDYPLGVGGNNFSSAYGRRYIPDRGGRLVWGQDRWLSAHSVYFRVLGEYGFLGLIWLITALTMTFRDNASSYRRLLAAGSRTDLSAQWPLLINVSLVGYATAAVFLGGVNYPHIYIIFALTASATRQSLLGASEAPAETAPRAAVAAGISDRLRLGGQPAPGFAPLSIEDRARAAMRLRVGGPAGR